MNKPKKVKAINMELVFVSIAFLYGVLSIDGTLGAMMANAFHYISLAYCFLMAIFFVTMILIIIGLVYFSYDENDKFGVIDEIFKKSIEGILLLSTRTFLSYVLSNTIDSRITSFTQFPLEQKALFVSFFLLFIHGIYRTEAITDRT